MRKEREIFLWAMALYNAVIENPSKAEEILANLKKALDNKKEIIGAVIKKFISIYSREQKAELLLAREMSKTDKTNIKEKIKKIIGDNKEILYNVDSSLLAGFRLKTKDVLIKASLKDILMKLKKYGYNRAI